MKKYYKNFILCGEADYYCLICREAFIIVEEVDKHLRWENHKKDVKGLEYVSKFSKDHIYKIADHYYCEICNLVTKSASEHIKDENHALLKASDNVSQKSSIIKRTSDSAVKINNNTITKHQWHSTVDNECHLCNETVVHPLAHFTSFIHMIKLIQSELLYKNTNYYRKIETGKYYCFTCYKVFKTSLDTHVAAHKDIKFLENEPKKLVYNKKSNQTNNNNKAVKMDMLEIIHEEHFNFDAKYNMATCNICEEIVKADFRCITQHRAIHATPDYINVDNGKRKKELKIYGNKNYIKLNEGGSQGYCLLCFICMSGHINFFKQHVEGEIHRGHLEIKGLVKDRNHEKPSQKGIPYDGFLQRKYGPFHIDNLHIIVINDGTCLEILSFTLIKLIKDFHGTKGKCFVCDVTLSASEIPKHATSKEHMKLFNECMIIPTEKEEEEFIRQIRPGLYHCGCCNKVFPFWETMKRHLNSRMHGLKRVKMLFLSTVCAQKYLNPLMPLEMIRDYILLQHFC